MDTSETYIKMCDCPEIQENTRYLLDGKDFRSNSGIWLPRQDQLQEMIKDNFTFICDDFELVELFFNFVWGDGAQCDRLDMISMGQFWLAFYMREKHGKVWSGQWVKE